MSLIVQKFGGSSVADAEKLLRSSQIIKKAYDAGKDVIAVVSAQGDATDRLLQKARSLASDPPPRELDALLAAGEQVSAALTAAALQSIGVSAVSLNAFQLPIRSDGIHGDARIADVGRARVEAELARRRVVVVTGFQGVDESGDLATLGRGGSDYTAVALAAAFGAEQCLIYTDVDGVYTADPRVCPTAKKLSRVSYADMYALSRAGARVLHDKCVALAQEKGVAPEVRSAAEDEAGTLLCAEEGRHAVVGVTGRVCEDGETASVTLVGAALPSALWREKAKRALSAAGVALRAAESGERTLTLRVPRRDMRRAVCVLHDALIE